MDVTALTLLILQINKLIDSGKYNDITIEDVHEAMDQKKVLRFLKDKASSGIDLSCHLGSNVFGNFEAYYEEKINSIYMAYAGDERRKWGIQNSGLCLILAWTNEIIQHGEGLKWGK